MRCPALKVPKTAPLGPPEAQPKVSALPPCVSQEGGFAASEHLAVLLLFLQSLLWWVPVERAFWRQVSLGSSASFSAPDDSYSGGLASLDPLPI